MHTGVRLSFSVGSGVTSAMNFDVMLAVSCSVRQRRFEIIVGVVNTTGTLKNDSKRSATKQQTSYSLKLSVFFICADTSRMHLRSFNELLLPALSYHDFKHR